MIQPNDAPKKTDTPAPLTAPGSSPAASQPVLPKLPQIPPAAPLPAPPAASSAAPALKLSLDAPATTPATPAPAANPATLRLSLSPTPSTPPAQIPSALKLTLNPTPPAPAAATPPPVPPVAPAAPPTLTPRAPAAPTAAPSIESLRQQFEASSGDDDLAREKAIATAALEPPELNFRLAGAEAKPPVDGAAGVTIPPIPAPGTPLGAPALAAPAAATGNSLGGLRVPTPELAAAFLASNPQPASVPKDAAPVATPAAEASRPPPPKPPRQKTANPEQILLVVGGVLAVLLGGGLTGAYLYLRAPAKPTPPPAVTGPVGPPATAPTADPSTVVATVPDPPAPAAEETTPATPTPTDPATPGESVAPAPATPPAPTPPPQPAPRVNMPDPTVLAWVQKIELTGIRPGAVPKVFMNGKLFEVGEVVNHEMGVKLVAVKGKVLHFVDSEGNTYEYRF